VQSGISLFGLRHLPASPLQSGGSGVSDLS
jgi:hypothetical protein